VTDDILDLMEEIIKHKLINSEYNTFNILIRKKNREAKEKETVEKCADIRVISKQI